MKNWLSEHKKNIFWSTVAALLPMLIGCILWNELPETIANHWGADGAADGFSSKGMAVFVLPGILAAMNLLCMLVTGADPKQRGQNKKAQNLIFWIMPILSWVVCGTVYAVAMGKEMNPGLLVFLLLGVMFLVMGNYMPKVKQNSTLGIKIHWTLCNEENWNKTHRFAGKVWVVGGVVMLFMTLLPLNWIIPVLLTDILVLVLMPTLYSYRIYKIHKAQGINYAAPAEGKNQKTAKIISSVLLVAVLAGVAVLMFTGEITYTVGNEELRIEATYESDAVVRYEEVDAIELREDFDIGVRLWGYASARLSLGAFQNEQWDTYTLYAYNSCDSMIVIRSGEKWLAFNEKDPAQTQLLYESIVEKMMK